MLSNTKLSVCFLGEIVLRKESTSVDGKNATVASDSVSLGPEMSEVLSVASGSFNSLRLVILFAPSSSFFFASMSQSRPYRFGTLGAPVDYRLVQKKKTVLLSTSLAWPAVAGCSRAETFSQLSSLSFAQPCTYSDR